MVGGRPVLSCTRCAGSVLLDVARVHGALVRVLPREGRPRDGVGRYVPRAPDRNGVR